MRHFKDDIMKKLCLIRAVKKEIDIWDQDNWLDDTPRIDVNKTIEEIPLLDHPHSDKENGQHETHYHRDFRYKSKNFRGVASINSRISLPLKQNEWLGFREVVKVSENIGITPTFLISKSKLKHKCIYKGKCPHRGYDLSNEEPDENGIITCPLHGLKFDTKDSNKLINDPTC